MSKKEIIWRHILDRVLSAEQIQFQQKEIARHFGYSLSTVFNALKIPRETGAIKVTGRFFVVENAEKLLYLWATFRRLQSDIIYATRVEKNASAIESLMPPKIIYGAYSAYAKLFGDTPADYDKVFVYADENAVKEIKNRFPPKTGQANLFALSADSELKKISAKGITPVPQIFVDIWNTSDWYAKDFIQAIREKIL